MKVELSGKGKLAALVLVALAAIGIAVMQGPDAKRYLKMETM